MINPTLGLCGDEEMKETLCDMGGVGGFNNGANAGLSLCT